MIWAGCHHVPTFWPFLFSQHRWARSQTPLEFQESTNMVGEANGRSTLRRCEIQNDSTDHPRRHGLMWESFLLHWRLQLFDTDWHSIPSSCWRPDVCILECWKSMKKQTTCYWYLADWSFLPSVRTLLCDRFLKEIEHGRQLRKVWVWRWLDAQVQNSGPAL